MAVLIASNLRKELGGDVLFEGVSFSVGRKDRLSLAGTNGAGKTTLLRALAGETSLEAGELAFAKGTRVALHDQRPPRKLDLTLREYALQGARDLLEAEADLRRLEQAMTAGAHDAGTLERYAAAQARLEHAGGWAWRDRTAAAVRGLGFRDDDLDRALSTFSGGELTRASLARALAGDPDLLLLDEPTNHLDVGNLEWLEHELQTLDAAVVLVAHDRWFLETVTTSVLELLPGGTHYFAGPWHEWRREKAERAAAAASTTERLSEDLARLQRFVDRFRYKESKAKQAQAKLTQIGRLEKERAAAATERESLARRRRTLGFEFVQPPRTGRVVLELEEISLSAGGKPLLAGATLVVERGEKVALVGPNGSGKTTLLEAILGRRPLDAGVARLGHGVVPGYFSQHAQELPSTGSVLDCAVAETGLTRPQAQQLLGRFLFSGWDMHSRQVGALSGGEHRRLALALLVASGANFLVLDEPTNHLDLESREALEGALEAFPGTVLLVSHDRALLGAVPSRIVAIENGTLEAKAASAPQKLPREKQTLPREKQTLPREKQTPPRAKKTASRPRQEQERPAAPTELELLEEEIAASEARVEELEARLAEDWTDAELLARHREAREELTGLFERWEKLFVASQS
jgi:ATP-binding cassette subfamily F protein 3